VRADPEPKIDIIYFNGQGTVPQSDAGRPILTNPLEFEGGMAWVALEQLKIGVGEFPNRRG
jgi:hypothetical protein